MKLPKRDFEFHALIFSFLVISICEIFLLTDVMADFFRLDIDTTWIDHQEIETIATVTLAFAMFVVGYQIVRLLKKNRQAQDSVDIASGELVGIIKRHFDEWHLSPSECEVALLLIKGMSTQEIAELRQTKPGTVKSQSSAIYQKAGVRGRNELVAYFVEDLLAGEKILSCPPS